MNLLNSFPEIEYFFKSEIFDDIQLGNLINHVKKIYTDPGIQTAALTLIKLEIAKFKMISNEPQNRALFDTVASKKKIKSLNHLQKVISQAIYH